jgi:hypothetical protein
MHRLVAFVEDLLQKSAPPTSVEALARAFTGFLKQHNLYFTRRSGGIDPWRVLSALGIRVRSGHIPTRGCWGLDRDGGVTVTVSADDIRWTQAFTLCHELFEILDDLADRVAPGHGPLLRDQERERLAEEFAAALYLPTKAFRMSTIEHRFDLPAIRRDWEASYPTTLLRMMEVLDGHLCFGGVIFEGWGAAPEQHGRQVPGEVAVRAGGGRWVEINPKPWRTIAKGTKPLRPWEAKYITYTRHFPRIPWLVKGLGLHPNAVSALARGPVLLPLRSVSGLWTIVGLGETVAGDPYNVYALLVEAKYVPWLRERMESRRTKGGTVMRGPIVQNDGRVVACVNCGFEGNETSASYCGICGACLYNRCTNHWCAAVNPPWRRYCGECGAKTRFHEYLRHDEALSLYARCLEAEAAEFEDLLESVQVDGEKAKALTGARLALAPGDDDVPF